jgi:MFS family permease
LKFGSSDYLGQVRSFSREARLYLAAVIVFALATAVPGVFLNLYFETLGFGRAFIGGVATVAQLGGAIASIPAALVLDRVGRRRSMIIGAIASMSFSVPVVISPDARVILGAQFVGGMGAVLYALAAIPLLAEVSSPRERTVLFSTADGLVTLGLFFGSVVAGVLPGLVAPLLGSAPGSAEAYRVVILGSFGFRVLGLIPLALIHDRAHDLAAAPGERSMRTVSFFDPRVLIRLRTPIWRYALPVFFASFGGALILPFLNLFLKQRFDASDATLGLVFGSINLAIGVSTLLGPLVAQPLGRGRTAAVCAILSGLLLLLIEFGGVFGLVAAAIVVRAGLYNMIVPLYRAFVIDNTPPQEYTIVNLILSTAANVGPTVGPTASGLVQDRMGFNPLFLAAAGLYGLAGVLYLLVGKPARQLEDMKAPVRDTG